MNRLSDIKASILSPIGTAIEVDPDAATVHVSLSEIVRRLVAMNNDVRWLISEVERLKWFEENFQASYIDELLDEPFCVACDNSVKAQGEHRPDCEYIKHKEKE